MDHGPVSEQQRSQLVIAACSVVVGFFGLLSQWLRARADKRPPSPVESASETERRMLDEAWIDRGLEIKQLRAEVERLRAQLAARNGRAPEGARDVPTGD